MTVSMPSSARSPRSTSSPRAVVKPATAAAPARPAPATAWVIEWNVQANHPAFEGHFPGQPILPGVVSVAQALEACVAHLGRAWLAGPLEVASAKFLSPLKPGDRCRITLQPNAPQAEGQPAPSSARLRFDIHCGTTHVVTGSLVRGAATPA
jgi:3-hydroxyacyl-[acyl-carrier-protein] dehydratase